MMKRPAYLSACLSQTRRTGCRCRCCTRPCARPTRRRASRAATSWSPRAWSPSPSSSRSTRPGQPQQATPLHPPRIHQVEVGLGVVCRYREWEALARWLVQTAERLGDLVSGRRLAGISPFTAFPSPPVYASKLGVPDPDESPCCLALPSHAARWCAQLPPPGAPIDPDPLLRAFIESLPPAIAGVVTTYQVRTRWRSFERD
jgi:hypothetical protein